ncbi:MAG: copper resistance protein CopC [Thermoleophilia bacterium]|nr:copper resistance protein CopC [Thermoleophilia bacterium]
MWRIVLVGVVALMAFVPMAGAHAVLLDTSPGDEATVDAAVDVIELRFNESVSVAFGGGKVWGPDGERVDDGSARVEGGKLLLIPINGADRGTYAVSYRVVSADGHPVRGASTFHVGTRSNDTVSEDKALEASAGNRGVEIGFGVARGIALAALLAFAGGVIFRACIAAGTSARFLHATLAVAALGVAASYVLDAANSAGFTVTEALRADVLEAEASTTWGRSALIQLALIAVAAVWYRVVDATRHRDWWRGVLVSLPAIAPLVAWSAGGHAVAADPVYLRLPLDVLHTIAAAVWLGGLVQLLRSLRARALSLAHVQRWSQVAMVAVGVLVATGLYASWVEIGLSREALVDTTYGRLVLLKVILLVLAMPLAWLNQRRNIPGLQSRDTERQDAARTSLRRYVGGEIAVLALVVVATAALIQTQPAKSSIAPKLVDRVVQVRGGGELQVVIDPARTGPNEIHVYVNDARGRLDESVTNVTMTASGGGRGIENLDIPLLPSGPGHFTTPAKTLPFDGSWNFDLSVARGTFDARSASFTASIGKADS